ncbi:M-phase phosphoprotein 9 [Thalassophryne amazonica]|uniref:M-phase phosphoprotein 9 n=1 Tax=Thalassophryne amazonica TaxID=390379 RepID=UPI001470E392|nr:M-phase phosphoprotein 9 [Thalassophryne amazonica]
MSTDDSISEDVSSSGALSHCHVSPDGDVCKESETSLVSSEEISASGLAVSEHRHAVSKTTGASVESRQMDVTPACNKIRSLCLSTDEAFSQGKNLPFINPSSLETLRALVQEIQSSGETDPEIWKDCEGRWLHLFQLVEKQYQEQILAQQEQYQCQIQLIQDEIKALVQLQNRQAHADFSPTLVTKTTTTKEYTLPSDCTISKNVLTDNDGLAVPAHTPFSSASSPLHQPEAANQGDDRVATVLSSGYGTLSSWQAGPRPAGSPEEEGNGHQVGEQPHWSSKLPDDSEVTVMGFQQDGPHQRNVEAEAQNPLVHQQRICGNQPLTSWAQRQKLRAEKTKTGQSSPQIPEYQEDCCITRESHKQSPLENRDSQEQHRPAGPPSSSCSLRRSDSLLSETSGLTYWHRNENDLYHPLPDSIGSGTYFFLQEASTNLTPPQEPQLSLKEIYQNKQRTGYKHADCEVSVTSSPLSPQVLTLDQDANLRHSDCTSGFTSPSNFSSPALTTQPNFCPRAATPVTPDSMVECSPNTGGTDCISDTSCISGAGPCPSKVKNTWGNASQTVLHNTQDKSQSFSHTANKHQGTSAPLASEEEGSHTHTSTLKPADCAALQPATSTHVDDPVVLSLIRQNLREKHSRHVADLKAYYESEIRMLRDKLKLRGLPKDLEKSNQVLSDRCKHLEKSLAEAVARIQDLEAKNSSLEKKLAEWPERYAVAGAAVKSLQQRLEESKHSSKEKDTLAARLKTRVQQLEEATQKACREADEKEARRERESKMLQNLLADYDSLVKEHEGVKNNLISTENKLVDANDEISELKRVISKLEFQVKQLEHENQARARFPSHSSGQPSGAGLFHHPDLLLSPSKCKAEPDVTYRKPLGLLSDQLNGFRKSPFPQTNQSTGHKQSYCSLRDQSAKTGTPVDDCSAAGSWRCSSPPQCETVQAQTRHQDQMFAKQESVQREGSCALTPMMRALIELEETRATASRAPWVGHQRTTVAFMERRHKEPIQERIRLSAERDAAKPMVVGPERRGGRCHPGAESTGALLRAQRSLSPDGHRSSSLPPPAQRNIPTTSPTKRETLLMPLSAKSSPKRCPTENYSTAFGHMMPREEHLVRRFEGQFDQRRHSFHISTPRKRLQFPSPDAEDDVQQPESSGCVNPPEGDSRLGWEEQGADLQVSCEDSSPLHSLADAERLFDELTQEKLQIEAALSRMPGAGGRVSLQTRLDEVALENRLERLNRQLGSIRMTLKRFHVLRSSANI